MSTLGKSERVTQDRVVALFRDELGYRYLGDRSDRPNNSNIEEDVLGAYLLRCGYSKDQASRALHLLRAEADHLNRSLYDNNRAVYQYLRYGVPVKTEAGKVTETVSVIDWTRPEKNDFAIAEEVTKVHAVCTVCGAIASRSQRLTPQASTVLVGGAESYEARCRACFEPRDVPRTEI